MSSTILLHVALSLALAPPTTPQYAVEIMPVKRVQTEYTLDYEAPKLLPKEWEFFVAQPPELSCQSDIRISCEPASVLVSELGTAKRPLQRIRVPVSDPKTGKRGRVSVKCEASLLSRQLVTRAAGSNLPIAAPLSETQRQIYVSPTATLDFAGADFQRWIGDRKLKREAKENDVDFARRVFLSIRQNFTYEYLDKMDRHAMAVCRAGKSDCGGLANVFVATLRSEGVPARTLVGRWALPAKAGEKVGEGEIEYFQQHVKAEFFAEGVGWVPIDVSSAVLLDKSEAGRRYFGNDPGDFLVLHVDSDFLVDTHYFGQQTIPWLQGVAYWVTGAGNFEGLTARENWNVNVVKE